MKPSKYTVPILEWLAARGFATTRQLVYRFFLMEGKRSSYGYEVVGRLQRYGLLRSEKLHPERGRVSQDVVSLSPAGWLFLGRESNPPNPGRYRSHTRAYHIQLTQVLLVREAEGWRLEQNQDEFELLRGAALGYYRGRLLNDSEAFVRRRLENMPRQRMNPSVIQHGNHPPRILLPAYRGFDHRRALNALPDMRLFPRTDFELVAGAYDDADGLRSAVADWTRERRMKDVRCHHVPPFYALVHPHAAVRRLAQQS